MRFIVDDLHRKFERPCITLLFVLYSVSFNFSKTHKINKASFCLRPWLAQIFKLFYRSLVLLAALTPL